MLGYAEELAFARSSSEPPPQVHAAALGSVAIFGATIFLSGFLLFSLEPLIAKIILPWFGGSAAVWSTCLVFYQVALLAGYFYAQQLARHVPARRQALIHVALLVASLALLPVGPTARWKPGSLETSGQAVWWPLFAVRTSGQAVWWPLFAVRTSGQAVWWPLSAVRTSGQAVWWPLSAVRGDPSWIILAMLAATIGLPFITLSATTPLLQTWLARSGHRDPYRFFAFSNFASLAALIAYPCVVEPWFDVSAQRLWWSAAYVCFAVLCAASAWHSRAAPLEPAPLPRPAEHTTILRKLWWFALAACGSMLLLSVTNHIDENVAAVPLLWVLPLTVYLASFVLTFGVYAIYKRAVWLRVLAFALGVLGYAVFNINFVEAIQVSIPLFLAGLFACCMFCHGELNRLRPETSDLTGFYLTIAAGGAAGAIFVGLIAPRIFSGVYELPLTLCTVAVLAAMLTWTGGRWPMRALWITVSICMAVVLAKDVRAYRASALSLRRSFYGSLRVVEERPGLMEHRTLYHGIITHGAEFMLGPLQSQPTTYYGPDSGIGIVLRECISGPKRVGIVGLGVGTIAAYGQPGDTFRFYDINQQVIDAAESLFFYLRETHARVEIVPGDARLSLERETVPRFDVLALDAFSGDAIPVHLLTREAVALYLKHLKPNGVLAFHVSNDFLDLAPVVRALARNSGYESVLVKNHEDDDALVLPADWVLVTRNPAVLDNPAVKLHSEPIVWRTLRLWTDDYSSLLPILKAPRVR